ncbi:hypothetical protein [Streptomyces sp. NPDC002133]|uniref:hypothetical protein n=1 Tax=Streptomyces sp. NPDC002133 TaxID=3154409 RepID=UPI0033176601
MLMPVTRVTVAPDSKNHAQHLAAELVRSGFQTEPASKPETDRSGTAEVVKEVAIVFFVHGAYDLVKATVARWRAKAGVPESQIDVEPDSGPDAPDDTSPHDKP